MQNNMHYYVRSVESGYIEYNANLMKEFYAFMPGADHKLIIRDLGKVTILELYFKEHVDVINKDFMTMYGYVVISE